MAAEMPRDEPFEAPPERRFTRRAFVKGCIYASAAGVAAVGAGATILPLSKTNSSPFQRVEFIGSTLVSGPAPQGIPLLPLAKGPGGELMGNAAPEGIEGGVLNWYRYCGHEATTGLQPGFAPKDEFLRYFLTQEKEHSIGDLKKQTGRPDVGWYLDRLGQVVKVEDFQEVGYGAGVNWRSEGATGKNIISAIVIKIDPEEMSFKNAQEQVVREQFLVPTEDGKALIAYVTYCKHFCCVPGWRESPVAFERDFFDRIYCTCHESVYDPFQIKGDFYMLQAELEEEGGGHA